MELAIPYEARPAEPLFRSRFGGLWTDRHDAHEILAERRKAGWFDDVEADRLAHYIDHGYVIIPGATPLDVIDEYLEFFERAWDELPENVMALTGGTTKPLSRDLYDNVAKISCLHLYFARADELVFPSEVFTFLRDIYERPPVAFQTMSMRKGSEEPLHIDTGPLTLTEPMSLSASWVALEDVKQGSGEFQYVPGSHLVPERLHFGIDKGHNGDMKEYQRTLDHVHHHMEERSLKTEYFMAKKGDVLIWHGDLMHGGAPIADASLTRKSLVAHFMPLGVMPNFYDSSVVHTYAYPNGGHCVDSILPGRRPGNESPEPARPGAVSSHRRKEQWATQGADRSPDQGDQSYIRKLKSRVPLPMRKFLSEQADWIARNPQLVKHGRSNGSRR